METASHPRNLKELISHLYNHPELKVVDNLNRVTPSRFVGFDKGQLLFEYDGNRFIIPLFTLAQGDDLVEVGVSFNGKNVLFTFGMIRNTLVLE